MKSCGSAVLPSQSARAQSPIGPTRGLHILVTSLVTIKASLRKLSYLITRTRCCSSVGACSFSCSMIRLSTPAGLWSRRCQRMVEVAATQHTDMEVNRWTQESRSIVKVKYGSRRCSWKSVPNSPVEDEDRSHVFDLLVN